MEQSKIYEPLMKLIDETKLPINTARTQLGPGITCSFGFVNRNCRGYGPAMNNQLYPNIYEELKKLCNTIMPGHNYTAFMLNVNYEAKPHRDRYNEGVSTTVSFGDFEGGEVVVHDDKINTRYCPITFRADLLTHSVLPITSGKRYSIVMFRQKLYPRVLAKIGNHITLDELEKMVEDKKHLKNSQIRIDEL
jgi:hypothetical protein